MDMKGGKKTDMAEVVRWTSKSAEGGYVPAQFDLGETLLNGLGGVATNEAAGVEWIRKAADAKPYSDDWDSQKSRADARYQLGVCYRDGRGIKTPTPLRTVVTVIREAIYKEGPNAALAYWIAGNHHVLTEGKSIILETCDKAP